MKLIVAGIQLEKLVQDFARRFPKLETKQGSFGKCKMTAYELALYLRRRGVQARLLHCQTVRADHKWLESAHASYKAKARKDWSHYVLAVGNRVIDMTGRQFDREAEHPRFMSRHELRQDWESVEHDHFMNRQVDDVLKAQMDANRVHREGAVKLTNRDAPQQQRLTSPKA
jgi:hypothetical protein